MKFKITKVADPLTTFEYEDGRKFAAELHPEQLTKANLSWIAEQTKTQPVLKDEDLPVTIGEWQDTDTHITIDYKTARRETYPTLAEQLDALYWARQGDDTKQKAVDDAIKVIKDRYPKDMTPFTLSQWRTEKTNRGITRPDLLTGFSGSFEQFVGYL